MAQNCYMLRYKYYSNFAQQRTRYIELIQQDDYKYLVMI